MIRILCGFLFLAAVPWAGPAWAGSISIQASITCMAVEGGVRVDVTVLNAGDEAANNVQVTARCRDAAGSSPIMLGLKPARSYHARISLETKLPLPGVYPVEVKVHFHDSNGRPFSAVSYGSFVFEEGAGSLIFAEPAAAAIQGRARLAIKIINTDQAPHRVRVRLVVPREFTVKTAEQILEVKAREKKDVFFDLENFSALEGAVYPVPAFVEYEAAGRHRVFVAENTIRVRGARNFFKKHRAPLIVLAAALALAVILIQLFWRKNGRAWDQDQRP